MKTTKERSARLFCSLMFGLLLLAGLTVPAFAQDKYNKGDEVIIDIYGDGRQVCNGVVADLYPSSSGMFYLVKWDCGDGYSASNSGMVPPNRLRPRGATRKPEVSNGNSNSRKPTRQPVIEEEEEEADEDEDSEVSADDLDWFFGKWKLSRFGGGSEVERGGKIYRETLMYVAKAAPITISRNGTYSWTVRDGSTVKGKWRKLKPAEDIVTGGKNGLVLLKGFDGIDWQVTYMGEQNGKESISIYSHLGNFDGARIGAAKGEPEWNKVQFSNGEAVIVTVPDGKQCNGEIDKPYRDYTGTLTYYVNYTCPGSFRTSGAFPAHKIRRR